MKKKPLSSIVLFRNNIAPKHKRETDYPDRIDSDVNLYSVRIVGHHNNSRHSFPCYLATERRLALQS